MLKDLLKTERQYAIIGKAIPRVDAVEKATGEACYLDDIHLPGMLYAAVLGSPYAHARILSIDISRAEKLPGVKAVLTGKDLPDRKFCTASGLLPGLDDKYPLEKEKVRCIGDEVAAVAAVDIETAEKAVELIKVEYEVLTPILDPEKAMIENTLRIHGERERNISAVLRYSFGDVDQAFKEAECVFEDTYKTSQPAPCCMETHGCIARWDSSGRLTLWSSTQMASGFRRELSRIMGIPYSDVRVLQPAVGGSFGSKMSMHSIEPIAAHLAKKTGRPVKLVYSREQEFVSSRTRHPAIIRIKTGTGKDGTITARECDVIFDNGAYNGQGPAVLYKLCTVLCSHYNVRNTRVNGYLVYTNKPWGGAFRGFGNPQANFAIESQMDAIAARLGIDAVELRLKNAIQPGDVTATGWEISSCGMSECIRKAAEAIDWENKRGRGNHRGVGLAACIHWGGGVSTMRDANLCSAIVEVNGTGQVFVFTGAPEVGEGANTVFTQIVAEEMGIPEKAVTIMPVDTDVSPSFFFNGSPNTFVGGGAARVAAADARRQLLEAAAELKSVNPDGLDIKNGIIFERESGKELVSVAEACRFSYDVKGCPIVGKGSFNQGPTKENIRTGYGQPTPTYCFAAQAVEVEVDPDTGIVKVLKCVTSSDSGKVINPLMAEGQIEGALAQGLGFALTEDLVYDDQGRVLNASFTDYKVFRASDMPAEVISVPVETADPRGPFGAKSLGEAVIVPVPAAVANAIADATGLRMKDLPITPEKISEAFEKGS